VWVCAESSGLTVRSTGPLYLCAAAYPIRANTISVACPAGLCIPDEMHKR